jgi:hypothetical protein
MKKLMITLSFSIVFSVVTAQEKKPFYEIVDVTGHKKYIMNRSEIKNYDIKSFNQDHLFLDFARSLPVIDIPTEISSSINDKYQSLSYDTFRKLLYHYDEVPKEIDLTGRLIQQKDHFYLKDSIFETKGGFTYSGIHYEEAPIEVHYKICPLGRINLNSNYYSILIYIILWENRLICLNNYTKEGKLLSSIEVTTYDNFYLSNKLQRLQRTIIDKDTIIHRVFMGGTATCEKYTLSLDPTGYFKTKKIQVYMCDFIDKILDEFNTDELINFTAGEILKAYIEDPDGYTNVRERPGGSSSVLYRIHKDEPFYIVTDLFNDNWYKIALYRRRDKSGKVEQSREDGYIHKSRVKIISKD